MSTLILDRVWINRLDTGEAVSAKSWDRARDMSVEGDVRTYGAGRRRSVMQVGRRNVMAFTLRRLSTLQVVRLEGWLGEAVMYRDYRGQRFVGAYYGLDFKEYIVEPDVYDIGITLHEVTWREGVV